MAKEKVKDESVIKDFLKEYGLFILVVILIIGIRIFICTPINVNGTSMSTTLKDGDIMLLNKIGLRTKKLKRFDIVVVRTSHSYIIKRIIGLPGETISYKNEKLYINGKAVEDKYNLNNTGDFDAVKIGKNEYFVMGDNRNVSNDSRVIGPVEKKDIIGKTNFVIFPFKKFGKVES